MLVRILKLPVVHLLLAITIASILHARFPLSLGIPSFVWGMSGGVIALVAAVAIAGSAMATMRKHRTTVEPGQRPAHLVTGGVFALTRNPIYLSMLLIVLAIALMTDAVWFVVAAAALCVVLDRVVIRWEERTIEDAFGAEYAEYRRRVRRWI